MEARDKESVALKEKLEELVGVVQARDKTIESYVALKEKLEGDVQARDKRVEKLNKEVKAAKAAGGVRLQFTHNLPLLWLCLLRCDYRTVLDHGSYLMTKTPNQTSFIFHCAGNGKAAKPHQ